MYIYIHGFNSNLQSRSFLDLSRIIPTLYDCGYDYTQPAKHCYKQLCFQIEEIIQKNTDTKQPIKLLGSSLGGFWALHLAEKYELPCLAFNPVTFAHEQLRPFLGINENFYTKKQFDFTENILLSYATFAFTRPRNLKPTLIIGQKDEILDPSIAYTYWNTYAQCILTNDTHSIMNYNKYKDIICAL